MFSGLQLKLVLTKIEVQIKTHLIPSGYTYITTQVTWDALVSPSVEGWSSVTCPSAQWEHVSGSESPFRSPLNVFSTQRRRKVGRQSDEPDLLQSPWIKSALITADLPWGMGLINRGQCIYLQIKYAARSMRRFDVILVTCWVGGLGEHRSHKQMCRLTNLWNTYEEMRHCQKTAKGYQRCELL